MIDTTRRSTAISIAKHSSWTTHANGFRSTTASFLHFLYLKCQSNSSIDYNVSIDLGFRSNFSMHCCCYSFIIGYFYFTHFIAISLPYTIPSPSFCIQLLSLRRYTYYYLISSLFTADTISCNTDQSVSSHSMINFRFIVAVVERTEIDGTWINEEETISNSISLHE